MMDQIWVSSIYDQSLFFNVRGIEVKFRRLDIKWRPKKDIKELISNPFGNQDMWLGFKLPEAPTIVTIREIIFGRIIWRERMTTIHSKP